MSESAEDRIARVARAAVEKALAEMQAVVLRYLAEGRKIDGAMMAQMAAELQRLASTYGQEIVIGGDLGKLMQEQRIAGAKAGGADKKWLALNADALKAALDNDRVKIKGVLDGGAAQVNEIITAARISGKPRAEVVAEIMERLKVSGEMTAARAETIYRSETYSTYRQFEHAAALGDEIEHFMCIGVIDSRTTDICLRYIGQVMTEKEWEDVDPEVFRYGLHYGCRSTWVPVPDPDADRIREREKEYRADAKREQRDRREDAA